MRILDTARQQYAVYWALAGVDDFGQRTFAAPVVIQVRWDDSTEVITTTDGSGKTKSVGAKSKVMVGQEVDQFGVLMRSGDEGLDPDPLSSMTTDQKNKPFSNDGAWEIVRFDSVPVLRPRANDSQNFYRVAWL